MWGTAEWCPVSWFVSPAYTASHTVDRPGVLDVARLRTCSAGNPYNHRTFFPVVTGVGQSCHHTLPPDSPSPSSLTAWSLYTWDSRCRRGIPHNGCASVP